MDGDGIFFNPDKSQYEGKWVQDEKNGYHYYTDSNGE